MLKSKSASCLASPICPRALARSPRSPPIATSFAEIVPSAVTEIVSPSGMTEPREVVVAGSTATFLVSSQAASAAVCAAEATLAESAAAVRWMRRSSHSHWQQRRKRRLRHYRIRGFRRGLFTVLGHVLGSFRRRGGG